MMIRTATLIGLLLFAFSVLFRAFFADSDISPARQPEDHSLEWLQAVEEDRIDDAIRIANALVEGRISAGQFESDRRNRAMT
jgi:hypothetical protein